MNKDRISIIIESVYNDGYDSAIKELNCDPFESSIVLEAIREIYTEKQDKREELAERDHDYWRSEMRDIYRKLDKREDGTLVIPARLVSFIIFLMMKRYDELPHPEKERCRDNADMVLNGLHINCFDVSECHFCGSEALKIIQVMHQEDTNEKPDSQSGYQVLCVNCRARGPGGNETPELALMAWGKDQKT